jgi:hypothetical protein
MRRRDSSGKSGPVADRPVPPILVVVLAPILLLFAGVGKRQEPMRVQALRPEPSVERFDEGVVGLPPRP